MATLLNWFLLFWANLHGCLCAQCLLSLFETVMNRFDTEDGFWHPAFQYSFIISQGGLIMPCFSQCRVGSACLSSQYSFIPGFIQNIRLSCILLGDLRLVPTDRPIFSFRFGFCFRLNGLYSNLQTLAHCSDSYSNSDWTKIAIGIWKKNRRGGGNRPLLHINIKTNIKIHRNNPINPETLYCEAITMYADKRFGLIMWCWDGV